MLKQISVISGSLVIGAFNPTLGLTFGAVSSLAIMSINKLSSPNSDSNEIDIDKVTFYQEFLDSHVDNYYNSLLDSGYDKKSALAQIEGLFDEQELMDIKNARKAYNDYKVDMLGEKPVDYKWFV
jgi:hypothetical protein